MTKYTITLDLDEGRNRQTGEARDTDKVVRFIQLSVQQALTRSDVLINRVDVKQGKAGGSTTGPRGSGTPGRKPINRPKVENWIIAHVEPGPSTQGTVGLQGVDKKGRPLQDAKNRIYIHRLAAPEPEGTGLSLVAIDKVLRELEVEGYLERGYAAGAPFYEYIRPLEGNGQTGIRGRAITADELPASTRNGLATSRTIDFDAIELD